MYDVIIGYTTVEPNEGFVNLVRSLFNHGVDQTNSDVSRNRFDFTTVKITSRNVSQFCDTAMNLNQRKTNKIFVFESGKTDKIFNVLECLKANDTISCSVLLLSPKCREIDEIVLKYDGTDNSGKSILAFHCVFPQIAENASNSVLISPNTFTRNRVVREKQFVKRIAGCYNSLGFIKLPLKSPEDFYNYSFENKMQMLVLTRQDLFSLPKLVSNKTFFSRLKKSRLSVFVRL